jgi:hypothetical protein
MKMAGAPGYVSLAIAKSAGWTDDRFNLAIVSFRNFGDFWLIFCRRRCYKKDWYGLIDRLKMVLIGSTSQISKNSN